MCDSLEKKRCCLNMFEWVNKYKYIIYTIAIANVCVVKICLNYGTKFNTKINLIVCSFSSYLTFTFSSLENHGLKITSNTNLLKTNDYYYFSLKLKLPR